MLILAAAEFGNSAEQREINHPQPLLSKEGGVNT